MYDKDFTIEQIGIRVAELTLERDGIIHAYGDDPIFQSTINMLNKKINMLENELQIIKEDI